MPRKKSKGRSTRRRSSGRSRSSGYHVRFIQLPDGSVGYVARKGRGKNERTYRSKEAAEVAAEYENLMRGEVRQRMALQANRPGARIRRTFSSGLSRIKRAFSRGRRT